MKTPAWSRLAGYTWGVLFWNILVALFGAYVRATGSGAGCGAHWPTCNGEIIPRAPQVETLIEFTHRATSGLAFLSVLFLFLWVWRAFPKGHPARLGAGLSLFFMITESLVGASLVLFGWVADNVSPERAVVQMVHLANTYFLLAALALTAWWASGGGPLRLRGQGAVGPALLLGLLALLFLSMSGAVTALGDLLFPVRNSLEALERSLTPGEHFLVRLRVLHPLIAVSVGLYVVFAGFLVAHLRPSAHTRSLAQALAYLYGAQLLAGLVNVWLKAPVWMQLLHLFLAYAVWLAFLLLGAAALAWGARRVELGEGEASQVHRGTGGATWKDYLALTKPRVISLLLLTTLLAMLIAAKGWPGTGLFLAVALGGYMMAGAANAINMVVDRDIDARMRRTAKRPTVTQRISSRDALLFAFALAVLGFAVLWWGANLLAATLALMGLIWYVLVYTLYLKRRTWQNIVIGGAAGAFPPLVGWAAVTGELSLFAWYLFALIFFWTPVHFWALALMIQDDYRAVGVPMLPVVLGERATVIQIALYALLTALISVMPLAMGELGFFYLTSSLLLNGLLILKSLALYRRPERRTAVSLYKYSMLYLALLFVAMAVDRVL
ncbi:protoheme IX farnesyltransferase [Thermus parvatiensis]|uniref:Protoheme IX farnesyltransferase n=1 Tax=Thermus parvatiensis TaxID=456163 RepID=A0A109QE27_9DEIN|nr:heme o synthase [Thermus parvatiensis]AMA74901.1 protoheme IX farnesyltransferase [Thermus parvatiensis]